MVEAVVAVVVVAKMVVMADMAKDNADSEILVVEVVGIVVVEVHPCTVA